MTILPLILELWYEMGKKTYNLFVYDGLYRLYSFPPYRHADAWLRLIC